MNLATAANDMNRDASSKKRRELLKTAMRRIPLLAGFRHGLGISEAPIAALIVVRRAMHSESCGTQ